MSITLGKKDDSMLWPEGICPNNFIPCTVVCDKCGKEAEANLMVTSAVDHMMPLGYLCVGAFWVNAELSPLYMRGWRSLYAVDATREYGIMCPECAEGNPDAIEDDISSKLYNYRKTRKE